MLYPTELLAHIQGRLRCKLERVKGIEPSYPAWKAGVLPLNYTRKLGNFIIPRGACQVLFPRRRVFLAVEQFFYLVSRLAGDVDAQL